MGVVLPAESHIAVDEVDQPVVGDCHPMRVAGQIVENVLWSPEGWLGIDDPAFSIERPDEGAKHLLLCHRLQRAGQAELSGAPRPFQAGDELASEYRAENLHRQEEWIERA